MFGDRAENFNPAEPEEFYRRMLQDWYYRTAGSPPPGGKVWWPLPNPPQLYQIVPAGSTPEPTDNLGMGRTCLVQPMPFDGSGYTLDTSSSLLTATDAQARCWGLCGENILCVRHGSILEVCEPGAPYHLVTLSGTLIQGGSATATLTLAGATTQATVSDKFLASGHSLPSGAVVGIEYDVELGEWIVVNAQCD